MVAEVSLDEEAESQLHPSQSDGEFIRNSGQQSQMHAFSREITSTVHGLKSQFSSILMLVVFIGILSLISFALNVSDHFASSEDSQSTEVGFKASSIAFGSCTAYDLRELSIWDDAILPSQPDAWIWTGDFVYLDDNEINCKIFESTSEWQQSCNCSASWLEQPPYSCHAGDLEYSANRWNKALTNGPYNNFLRYMCPRGLDAGYFPPPGSDPALCDKPIWGVYDDHDFGWNNGNKREPSKSQFKELYLDALGEYATSVRRNSDRGAWIKYTLNQGDKHREVDIFVLDERYEREALPCDTRRAYCEHMLASTEGTVAGRAWCRDFLHGGDIGTGSCCKKDEDIFFGWCQRNGSRSSPYYRSACDVSYEHFGMQALELDDVTGELVAPSDQDKVDSYQDSPLCEVLGKTQRRWLRNAVQRSSAALQVFVSGSVLLYNPAWHTCGTRADGSPIECRCGGDNLDCYRTAQRELLHTITYLTKSCAIVLTGDYHFSDIKALQSGYQRYADYYNSSSNSKTVFQVMASGMSSSTARNVSCEDYRLDPMGLRTHPECSFVTGPNFGKLVMEYDEQGHLSTVRLQILSGVQANEVLLETIIDPRSCSQSST